MKKVARRYNMLHKTNLNVKRLQHYLLSGGADKNYRTALCETFKIPYMSDDRAAKLVEIAQEMRKYAPDSSDYQRACNELVDTMTSGIPMENKMAISSLLKTNMLTRPSTHLSNFFGNFTNLGLQKINDTFSAGMENILVKTGKMSEEDRVSSVAWKFGEEGKKRLASIKKTWDDVAKFSYSRTGKHSDPLYMAGHRYDKMFREDNKLHKVLNKYGSFVSGWLEKEDMLAAKFAFTQKAGSMMKAQGLTEVTPEICEAALESAKYYTFHTSSSLTDIMRRIKKIPLLGDAIDLGVMPFVATPASILKQAVIDYNPVQFVRGITRILRQNGGDLANAVALTAKGLTGIGLHGLGFFLATNGWISIVDLSSGKEATLGNSTGSQEYALRIGPATIDVSNLAPAMIPVFQTAAVVQYSRQEDADLWGYITAWGIPADDAAPWGSFTKSFLDRNGNFDAGKGAQKISQNIAGTIVPNIIAGAAGAVDNTSRTRSDGFTTGLIDKVASDFPFYSYTRNAKIDMWGNEIKKSGIGGVGGNILNAINSTVNPYKVKFNPYADDALTQEVVRLYNLGYSEAVPPSPSKTMEIGEEKYTMTNTEYEEFCRDVGKARYNLASGITHNSGYQAYDDKKKAEDLQQRYQNAYNSVKKTWASRLASKLETD